jgi:hypothetical protein
MAKTRRRGGAPNWGKIYEILMVGVLMLKTLIRTAIKAGKIIPEFILNQYIYKYSRAASQELKKELPKIENQMRTAMMDPNAKKILMSLDINEDELRVLMGKVFVYINNCVGTQSIRSITEWYPIAVQALKVFKITKEDGELDVVSLTKRKDALSAYLKSLMEPPKKRYSWFGERWYFETFHKTTNLPPEIQMLQNIIVQLLENLTNVKEGEPPRNLLKGVFSTTTMKGFKPDPESVIDSIKKTVVWPAVEVADLIIEEILYLFVVDIGNMYTNVYDKNEDLKDAILKLINKVVQSLCMSFVVSIRDQEIEDLKVKHAPQNGGNPEKDMKTIEDKRKTTVSNKLKLQPKDRTERPKTKKNYEIMNEGANPLLEHNQEKPEGEIAAVLRIADGKKELPPDLSLIVNIIRIL